MSPSSTEPADANETEAHSSTASPPPQTYEVPLGATSLTEVQAAVTPCEMPAPTIFPRPPEPGPHRLRVRVVDAQGDPVVGVGVGARGAHATSNLLGWVTLHLNAGEHILTRSSDDCAFDDAAFTVPSDAPITLVTEGGPRCALQEVIHEGPDGYEALVQNYGAMSLRLEPQPDEASAVERLVEILSTGIDGLACSAFINDRWMLAHAARYDDQPPDTGLNKTRRLVTVAIFLGPDLIVQTAETKLDDVSPIVAAAASLDQVDIDELVSW